MSPITGIGPTRASPCLGSFPSVFSKSARTEITPRSRSISCRATAQPTGVTSPRNPGARPWSPRIPVAYPEFYNGRGRGAAGAEGVRHEEGDTPSLLGERSGKGLYPFPRKFFVFFLLKTPFLTHSATFIS